MVVTHVPEHRPPAGRARGTEAPPLRDSAGVTRGQDCSARDCKGLSRAQAHLTGQGGGQWGIRAA